MNSNYKKSTFDFDLGISSNNKKPLNDQKTTRTTSSWQSSKPSWTHQPIPVQHPGSLNGPTSMVGDITGKSWNSSSSSSSVVGIVKNSPNLFSDLVGLGQGKSGNVPLKNVTANNNKGAYSMGGLADSLPKTGGSAKSGGNFGAKDSFGGYRSNNTAYSSQGLGGPSMKSSFSGGIGSDKDPFESLVDFSSKPAASVKQGDKGNVNANTANEAFGDFQNTTKVSANTSSNRASVGSHFKMDDFGIPGMQNQPPVQSSGADAFDVLFSLTSASSSNTAKGFEDMGTHQFSAAEDWGFGSQFEGEGGGAMTTELDGLPPPPAGVTASSAKNKGMDMYKNGLYPDAIKWLSWAIVLLEKAGDNAGAMEVLSSRASSYKEVGEYKKAVADCTKVLEQDGKNVSVLVQRALLYESMEKYKLGAEDFRTVLKLDPGNKVARSTIHRLTKMVD